ncbi:bifunctional 2-polyprenyl-6-hydroxyphenol methylase/3-demethylubiquinol 3-O-methyltransferase UbiG [Parvibium lacunae]|uniref:Ubiquinone biosynthesis O-methyltransferase n=1 Tax=Parvibium lacunae TaxID=1888893 RepID=A0A368L6F0_9BURK|nr:bifunctional 2-polyprenyl-6-hydroxyphenol methylase/3-demethylubiquinol 3-O-methyltransferase UbiG [Parvibium lacunae]RCS59235.1 bifunctional 2-polyprenyl-6-hydroxyphenol methylase/3-demethylubiquinol 3-O-methyltransferase UbiG [Parvibium lacunae]
MSTTSAPTRNADEAELQKFSALASKWWDPTSEFKPLHLLNPVRLDWIDQHASLTGKRVLDVGCGGGILSESMSQRGADVLGIDLAEKSLQVARLHALETGAATRYECTAVEALAAQQAGSFDVVTCMEMLEHVPDPGAIIGACAALVKPGGWVFFSTLNRGLKAYLFAILGAEYLLRMLPIGTHDYRKFIRPAELIAVTRACGLDTAEIIGMHYHPLQDRFTLGPDTSVNYMVACHKPA